MNIGGGKRDVYKAEATWQSSWTALYKGWHLREQ